MVTDSNPERDRYRLDPLDWTKSEDEDRWRNASEAELYALAVNTDQSVEALNRKGRAISEIRRRDNMTAAEAAARANEAARAAAQKQERAATRQSRIAIAAALASWGSAIAAGINAWLSFRHGR